MTKYNVLPLDDRAQERFNATLAGRPDYMGGRTSLTLYPGTIAMKENAFIDLKNRGSSITAELESGGSGVIVSQGGSHSGWSFYVNDGRPAFAYEDDSSLESRPPTADVGLDLYSPVTTAYAKGDNQFTGTIKKVTIAVK